MDEDGGGLDWIQEYEGQLPVHSVGGKRKGRGKAATRKLEFVGWGSRPLIQFLESIGTDTSQPISHLDVNAILNKYVSDRGLLQPPKKKKVLCDQFLRSLFGKKTLSRIKIYDLLHDHFAENQLHSDDDFFGTSEEDESHQNLGFEGKTQSHKKLPEKPQPPKSCFAAIIPNNIKLIYLKRSLVQDLLKDKDNDPQMFECKIVGSFVRIKSDPNDYLQKNSHMLVQVTGLKKCSGTDEKNTETLLQVSNFIKDVCISMLSDDNFSEEECKDLHRRIREGLLKRPTIVQFEEKAQVLHEDITKHWLHGELSLLQKLIDRANEKGWRKELSEYLERRQLLQTADEQTRLLHEVPRVIADEIELEATLQDPPVIMNQEDNISPKSILTGALEIPFCNTAVHEASSTWRYFGKEPSDCDHDAVIKKQQKHPIETQMECSGRTLHVEIEDDKDFQSMVNAPVIDLSDDDDEDEDSCVQMFDHDPGSLIWYYVDPQGDVQGPFSITSLRRWKNEEYFPPDFKVWKKGQSQKEAVLLNDILHQLFPNEL